MRGLGHTKAVRMLAPLALVVLVALVTSALQRAYDVSLVTTGGGAALRRRGYYGRAAAAAMADGCRHVYVDLGTNTGVQIHKLYNASLFPSEPSKRITNKIGPVYDRYFGNGTRTDVCAFGFEPNKNHTKYLVQAQAYYRARGYRLTYFQAAAGITDGWGVFQSDNNFDHHEWGGRVNVEDIASAAAATSVAAAEPGDPSSRAAAANVVSVIGVPRWLDEEVLSRTVPAPAAGDAAALPPAVVMKIDVEGTDEVLLADMFSRGLLCKIDYIYVEHISDCVLKFLRTSLAASKCKTVIEFVDDESYHRFIMPEASAA